MAVPTNSEQLTLELINATRLDPFGHASTYISSYEPLTSPIPSVQNALNFFQVTGSVLRDAFAALTPVQPLAWNDALGTAADNHSQEMITFNAQEHVFGQSTPGTRATAAGYQFATIAENIFAFAQSEIEAHAAFMVDWGLPPGATQPTPPGMQVPPGHRNSIMNGDFRELGVGTLPDPPPGVGPLVMTQNFGDRFALNDKALVLGVAFQDGDGDRFYDIGEGQGGVGVASGAANAATAASGGYTLELAGGAHTLTFSGGAIAAPIVVNATLAAGANVKLDVVSGVLLKTSASVSVSGGATQIEGLGIVGLALTAGAGDQALIGTPGGDTLQGGEGSDLLFASHWLRTLGSGADNLQGGGGNDAMWGFDGADTLTGDLGSDGLVGGAGNDTLSGGDAADFLFGGDFSAVDGSFLPNSGDDLLNGGAGADGLWGFDQNDAINGEAGNDYIEGGLGSDVIAAGADNDTMLGQDGADTMLGGVGFDYIYGGAGADVFSFRKGDSYDSVWDFSAAEGDKLRLDPAFGVTGLADFQSRLTGFVFEGAAYTVFTSVDGLDQIQVKGIAHTAWTAASFELA
jgi:Ca2+-binding RTX toxin-like protein